MVDDLKPCPWCGGKAIVTRYPANCCLRYGEKPEYIYHAICTQCDATAPNGQFIDGWMNTEKEATAKAIEAWNKRR